MEKQQYESDLTRKEKWQKQWETIRRLKGGERLEYLWQYYKSVLIIFAAVILVIYTAAVMVSNAMRDTLLTVVIVDSELSMIEGPYKKTFDKVYNYSTMNALIRWCRKTGLKMNDFVYQSEGEGIHDFLKMIWDTMKRCVEIGLQGKGVLPGGLNLPRKARDMYRAAQRSNASLSVASPSFILCRSTPISSPTRWLFPRTTRAARSSSRRPRAERAASCPVCSIISTNTTKTSPSRTASTRSPSPA